MPDVNNLMKACGCWAFAEFADIWQMQHDFAKKVEAESKRMLASVLP